MPPNAKKQAQETAEADLTQPQLDRLSSQGRATGYFGGHFFKELFDELLRLPHRVRP